MKIINTPIKDLVIFEPKIFNDNRGYFFESYNKKLLAKFSFIANFIQDNEAMSYRGVLRGFHFQHPPFDQAKLVRCIKGEILDVVIDIRTKSKTYGKHFKIVLSEKNKKQLFIPRGFAHAYLVLSQEAIFSYKVDNKFSPDHNGGIIWNDKDLEIDWEFDNSKIVTSEKDKNLISFNNLKSPF